MPDIIFWGAAGHARVLREALTGTDWRLIALVDRRIVEAPPGGIPVLHDQRELDQWLSRRGGPAGLHFAVAVGAPGRDRLVLMALLTERGLAPLTIVHRTAFVAADATLNVGCQVLAQAAVCSHARLGRCVIVNTSASVDHDCAVGDGVHIAPGARIAGEVTVEEGAFIGAGAVVLPHLRVGKDAVVGAGAIVTRDVPAGAVVVGNPAKLLSLRNQVKFI